MLPHYPIGTLFQLTCKSSNLSLSIQNSQSPHNSRIIGIPSNPQQLCQLWYLSPIPSPPTSPPTYTLLNAVSDLPFQQTSNEIRLLSNKRKTPTPQYRVQEVKLGKDVYYVFRNLLKTGYVACLQGILKSKMEDEDEEGGEFFRMEVCGGNWVIGLTCFIGVAGGGMGMGEGVIGVPEGKKEEGVRVEVVEKTGRFNERWVFVQVFNNWVIKNFKTGLVMEVREGKGKGRGVVQAKRGNSLAEIWIVERVEKGEKGEGRVGEYYVKSMNWPEYWLGVEEGRLGIVKKAFKWRIEGFQP